MRKRWGLGLCVLLVACGGGLPSVGQQSEQDRFRVELDRCVDDAATLEQSKMCRAQATAAHKARRGMP
jgi:hypothetical protein